MGEKISKEEYDKLKEWYSEQLLRKDKEIERLKSDNQILLRSALKQAEMNLDRDNMKLSSDR